MGLKEEVFHGFGVISRFPMGADRGELWFACVPVDASTDGIPVFGRSVEAQHYLDRLMEMKSKISNPQVVSPISVYFREILGEGKTRTVFEDKKVRSYFSGWAVYRTMEVSTSDSECSGFAGQPFESYSYVYFLFMNRKEAREYARKLRKFSRVKTATPVRVAVTVVES